MNQNGTSLEDGAGFVVQKKYAVGGGSATGSFTEKGGTGPQDSCTDDTAQTGCAVRIWCRSVNLNQDLSGAAGGTGNRPSNQYGIIRSVSATLDGVPEKTSPC